MQKNGEMSISETVDDTHNGIKAISDDFLNSSTLHGVNKLNPSGIPFYRRGLWLCFILGCAAYMTYTVIEEFKYYYTYPTATTIKVKQERELWLPAVTICNLSPYKKSLQPSVDPRFDNFMIESLGWARNLVNWSDPYYHDDFYQKPITSEFMFNISFTVDEVFYSCKFDTVPFTCSHYIERVATDVGPCFVFNKDGKLKTSRNGAHFNMFIGFNVHQDEYSYSFTDGSGIKFAIHEPGYSPYMYSGGFVVPPGSMAYAAIDRKIYKYLPYPFQAFGDKYCVNTESKNFKNPNKFSNYTSYSCFLECMNDVVKRRAGCLASVGFGNGPFCSYANYSSYFAELGGAFSDGNTVNECSEKCIPSCKWVEFDTKISYAEYPSRFRSKIPVDILPDEDNHTYEYYRQNILMLNVYFEKLTTTQFEMVPVYSSVGDVFAKVGGQMGLFVGASILTLTELLEFCFRLFLSVICQNKKNTHFSRKTGPH